MGSLAQAHQLPVDVRQQPLRVVEAPAATSVSREDNSGSDASRRDGVARRRERNSTSTSGKPQGRPRRFASAPPRARTGHPILATCEARDRAPRVPIGQASVSRRIRRGRLRAVLDSLARGESLG